MPISGLVITLSHDERLRDEAMWAIRAEPRVEIGVCQGLRLAVVLESETSEDDQKLWSWLHQLPGVEFVDVAFVGFDALQGDEHEVGKPLDSFSLSIQS